jgi:hypothetical protein
VFRLVVLFVAILIGGVSQPVRAFHTLDCGPFRTTIIDKKTGERTCLALSPVAQEQLLRSRKLQQEQERRTNDLLLKQRQRAKAQELIDIQERSKQQQFTRGHSRSTREPARSQERTSKIQEGLARQDQEAKRGRERVLESALARQQNLLEQKLKLPRADLLDEQKNLNKRLLKDQSGQ